MNKVIEISNLHKVYTETAVPVHAVNDISLSLSRANLLLL